MDKFAPKPLIILDIDQTLLHACVEPLQMKHDFTTRYTYVYKRPYVSQFLQFCRDNFEVAIWTTAGRRFAEQVQQNLLAKDYPLNFVKSLEDCTVLPANGVDNEVHLKDLNQLDNQLQHIIMIDDSPEKLQLTPSNLIAVKPFFGDQQDNELCRLMTYLDTIKTQPNIGSLNKQQWQSVNYQDELCTQ